MFVGWFAYFVYTLWRFSARAIRKADYQGVRSHASSYIEVVVAGVEARAARVCRHPAVGAASNVTKISE